MFLSFWKDGRICDGGFGIGKIGDGDTNPAICFWLLLYLLRIGGFKFKRVLLLVMFCFPEFSD